MAVFKDREEAGRKLAQELSDYQAKDNVIVLGLPRGGVPIAYKVAQFLNVPLDVFLVRKLGLPGQPELAMGAIASGDVKVMNNSVLRRSGIAKNRIEKVVQGEKEELERREKAYRGTRPNIKLENKIVILVDDGLATGASMRAAIRALKESNPQKIIMAIPTAPEDTFRDLKSSVDEAVCLTTPSPFWGVGGSYQNFSQISNQEVRRYLKNSQ